MSFWKIEKENNLTYLTLNRPQKLNAFTWQAFLELPEAVEKLKTEKVVIIKGADANFSSGLDFKDFLQNNADLLQAKNPVETFEKRINLMQEAFLQIKNAPFITIAEISGYCIGAGLNLIALCDLRYAIKNTTFSLKELEFGIVPDLGALNFLPEITGEGFLKDITFTARNFTAEEAYQNKLLNKIFDSQDEMNTYVQSIAKQIIAKDKTALTKSKEFINNKADLKTLAHWNANYLLKSGILKNLK